MQNAPQGLAWFPGINQILDAHFTFGHGISPSVCAITIAPQVNFVAQIGTLVFAYGGDQIQWPGARLDNASFERNSNGEVWRLSLFDRRWQWKWGAVFGSFNLRYEDFESNIKYGSEATPQALARFCLDAMGESGYDNSALPNETRPTIEWDGEVPAEALANLCDDLGCRVVLGLDNRVRICQAGVGAYLPTDGIMEASAMLDPPEKPSAIGVLCGRTRYQFDFELEPVGQEWDGEIRLIDNLSYKPARGWDSGDVESGFASMTDTPDLQQLAAACVYKWYRVKVPIEEVPGFGRVNHLWQLAFEEGRCDSVLVPGTDPSGGVVKKVAPPQVYGKYWGREGLWSNTIDTVTPLSSDDTSYLYALDWSLDAAQGIVKFSEPVYANIATGAAAGTATAIQIGAAQLFLRAACNIRDERYRAWQRWSVSRTTDAPGNTATRWIKHDELVLSIYPEYGENLDDYQLEDNRDTINREADYYIQEANREYQYPEPRTVRYAGLRYIELDGAIQQIEFDVGSQGATTRASRNSENKRYTIPYKERRRLEQGRRFQDVQRQLSPSARWRARGVERAQ